jgi:hypothetical protein
LVGSKYLGVTTVKNEQLINSTSLGMREINKKILMVCYYFPPLLDVGCKRSVAFSKYLKSHGWEPHVLSVKNPDRNYCMIGKDEAPCGINTTYVRSLLNISWFLGKINGLINRFFSHFGIKPKNNYTYIIFCVPDLFIGWIPGSVISGLRIIKKQNIDYIYISCSPFSSAISGIILKKLTGKPLIVDFRDPFAVNLPDIFDIPKFRKKINIKIEKTIISYADIFVVNSEEVRKGYLAVYPEIESKTITIHNGFDGVLIPSMPQEKYLKFTVVYGGNLYLNAIRSESFFEAISSLKKTKKISQENFQFLYFGQNDQYVNETVEKYGITDLVQVESTISHVEMLKVIMKSHMQLLRIVKPMISTKLFEGIALNVPFLATIPKGEVADIIFEYSPSSYILHDDSPQEIGKSILAGMESYQQGNIKNNFVSQFLEIYSREQMTRKLEIAIEKVL